MVGGWVDGARHMPWRDVSRKIPRHEFCGGLLFVRGPSSSAEVRVVVIHDIKEVEGVREQEVQEDKRDEEIGDEVNGDVEEITQHTHENMAMTMGVNKAQN